jgi:ubiquinone/menaquinone biosynthesis C-methylase UbiE
MAWLVIVPVALVIALAIVIVATDRRYFGKGLVYQVYDRLGPALFSSRSEEGRWRELAALIDLRGDEAILDVGTAVGDLPLRLASMPGFSGRVVGIDWSPRMVDRANEEAERRGLTGRARFQVVDVRRGIPFPDGEFDVVVCMGLIETLAGPETLLAELVRVLGSRGTLVVSVYRGTGALAAALSRDWYETQLSGLGLGDFHEAALRRTQDILIARRKSETHA